MVGMVMDENSFSSMMVAGSRDSYSVMIVLLSSSAREGKPSAVIFNKQVTIILSTILYRMTSEVCAVLYRRQFPLDIFPFYIEFS